MNRDIMQATSTLNVWAGCVMAKPSITLSVAALNQKSPDPSCSKAREHYPRDKSLSSGQILGKPIKYCYPLDRDLIGEKHYPTFKQLGPRPPPLYIHWKTCKDYNIPNWRILDQPENF